MLKRILIVSALFLLIFVIGFFTHQFFVTENLPYSLFQMYFFHVVATTLVYIVVEVLAKVVPNQEGYAYLMMMCFKIGAFVLIFQNSVFGESLSKTERVSLVLPLFLFLIAEVIAVGRLLNSK